MKILLCGVLLCSVAYGQQAPKGDDFNLINDQARNTVISVPDGSYQYDQHTYQRFRKALKVCDKKYADETTTVYWVGRVSQHGKLTISKFIPETQFMACADQHLRKMKFKRPPSTKFDEFGGYPISFKWTTDQ